MWGENPFVCGIAHTVDRLSRYFSDGPDLLCRVVASTCRCWKTAFHVSTKNSSNDFFVRKPKTGFNPWSYCNTVVKGCGVAVGITDNPAAIRCWMLARPKSATWPMTLRQFQERKASAKTIHVYPSSVLESSNTSNQYFSIHGNVFSDLELCETGVLH